MFRNREKQSRVEKGIAAQPAKQERLPRLRIEALEERIAPVCEAKLKNA
jgi:hypothetical protein